PAVTTPLDASPRITSVRETAVAAQTTPAAPREYGSTLMTVYVIAGLVLLGRVAIGTRRAHRLMRRAVRDGDRWTSDDCTTPVTVGWLRPMIILPRGW